MDKLPIVFRDPADLRPLPELKLIPRWDIESEAFHGFCDDIKDNGLKHPIQITADNRVVDGETRRLGAKALQLKSVPCVIVPDDEVNEIILRELVRRRNLTKGQLAFLSVPLVEPAFEEARKRRSRNAAKTNATQLHSFSSVREYAALLGFSYELLRQAREIHELFAKNPKAEKYGDSEKAVTLEDYIRPRILNSEDPMSLGGALAAIGYLVEAAKHPHKKNGGKPKNTDKQLKLFNDTIVKDELNRWEYWQKFDDDTKSEHFKTVRTKAVQLPPEQCEELAEYHTRLAKEFKKAAKREAGE